MRVLSVNLDSREGDIPGNVARAEALIRKFTHSQPVDLVLLPEICTCAYCALDLSPWAENSTSETFRAFHALAEELQTIIGWGFAERTPVPGKVYNSFALQEPGKPPVIARKTHLHRSSPGQRINEPEFLLPGEQLTVFDTRCGRLGLMICYDGCFVEVPRALVLMGADCLLWPARSGGYLAGTGFPRIRAIDNLAPIIMAEGAQHGELPLANHAQIVDHLGNMLEECRSPNALLYADIDLNAVRRYRAEALNAGAQYRVRRPELYGPITRGIEMMAEKAL